jgi:hypothetical protein
MNRAVAQQELLRIDTSLTHTSRVVNTYDQQQPKSNTTVKISGGFAQFSEPLNMVSIPPLHPIRTTISSRHHRRRNTSSRANATEPSAITNPNT